MAACTLLALVIFVIVVGVAGKKGSGTSRRSLLWPAGATLVLAAAQGALVIWARPNAPHLAALHPVVGVAMFSLMLLLERRAATMAARRGMPDAFGRSPQRSI